MSTLLKLTLFGEICHELVAPVVAALRDTTANDAVELLICSPGGDCSAGFAVVDAIRTCPARVVTIGTGDVCSVALDILVAGDWRCVTPLTVLMAHPAFLPGRRKGRRPKELQLEDWRGGLLFMDKTRFRDEEQLKRTLFNGKDVYMTANQALDLSLVDEIVRIK